MIVIACSILPAALAAIYWRKGGFRALSVLLGWFAITNAVYAACTPAYQHVVSWVAEPVGVVILLVGVAPVSPLIVACSMPAHLLLSRPAAFTVDSAVLQLAAFGHLVAGISLGTRNESLYGRILTAWFLLSAAAYYASPQFDLSGITGYLNIAACSALGFLELCEMG
jgi:hypothetical protein